MNLHNIVGPCVAQVNPWVTAQYQQSTGYTTSDDGGQVPSYAVAVPAEVQMQALQYNDIIKLDGMNIQGVRRALYINGNWEGLVRTSHKGGDLVTLPDASVWLVVLELENWSMTSGWCKCAVTLQDGA